MGRKKNNRLLSFRCLEQDTMNHVYHTHGCKMIPHRSSQRVHRIICTKYDCIHLRSQQLVWFYFQKNYSSPISSLSENSLPVSDWFREIRWMISVVNDFFKLVKMQKLSFEMATVTISNWSKSNCELVYRSILIFYCSRDMNIKPM